MVAAAEDQGRIDVVVADHVEPPATRAQVKRWIEAGHVTVDGSVAGKAGSRLRAGMRVRVEPPAPPPSLALPEAIPLEVLYEDEDLVVLSKPAGLVVHPAAGHAAGTLVNALLHRYPGLRGPDALRPGIVHRLDKDTSGVMVVARSEAAQQALARRFHAHDIERAYWAIVAGHPPSSGTFDTMHGRHPTDRKRFTTRVVRGRRAITRFRVLERLAGGAAALVEARLETGRTHQVRVHFAEHGWPILGDPVYGGRPRDPCLRRGAERIGRQALHAKVLGFPHPTTGRVLAFDVPPPADFVALLQELRGSSGAP